MRKGGGVKERRRERERLIDRDRDRESAKGNANGQDNILFKRYHLYYVHVNIYSK